MKTSNFFYVSVTEYNDGYAVMINHRNGRRIEMVHLYDPEEWELRIVWEDSTKDKFAHKNMEDAMEMAFKMIAIQ